MPRSVTSFLNTSSCFGARIHEPDTDDPIIRSDGMGSTALESTAFERLLDGRRCRSSRAGNGDLVELTGIEPVTSGLQSRRSPS